MSELPLSLADLTPEFVADRLFAGGHDVDVATIAVHPLEGFAGIMGEVAVIDLTFGGDTDVPSTLIAKCPLDDDTARMYNQVMNSYKRENGFYRDLADRVPMRVPECYVNEYDEESGRGILLIEKIEGELGDILAGADVGDVRHTRRAARHDARPVLAEPGLRRPGLGDRLDTAVAAARHPDHPGELARAA